MASAVSHALVALALGKISQHKVMTWPIVLLGVVCSIVPDLDVIGFRYGIQYDDVWGHRGLTHSFFFAGLLSAGLVGLWYRRRSRAVMAGIFFYFFLCTASHGVLDAMTDGGLGVAFFSPFDTSRYFFGVRPVAVSPIGIGEFMGEDAVHVLASEAKWIWLPTGIAFVVFRTLQRLWLGQPAVERSREE
ncbi:MAG: metal-dependent hydrolase [Nitrospiraceae bacterium]